jgi:DNA modification methylase
LLTFDLDFHTENSSGISHDFHAFPAKFPPQLPRLFIEKLTQPGDVVLDPMMGSGTSVLEAYVSGRTAIGFDIDPLAVLLTKVKLTPISVEAVADEGERVLQNSEYALKRYRSSLSKQLTARFEPKTKKFVDYWFSEQAQLELLALLKEIEKIDEPAIQDFLRLVFSAIIITKSGGVSLAWDLAHTRPHKLKQGLAKAFKSPFGEFRKRLAKNLKGLREIPQWVAKGSPNFGNAEALPLAEASVDLLFTSPPYASTAIDYMRAHKFSLVWFGYPVEDLSELRTQYIGGENIAGHEFADMPLETKRLIAQVARLDRKKSLALHRYYSEMKRVLQQSLRVLRPGKAAFFVVGSSTLRGIDTRTQDCLGEIGESLGFELLGIGTRRLDRNRRMMPARRNAPQTSIIEQRMHEEFVVGLLKPERVRLNGKN